MRYWILCFCIIYGTFVFAQGFLIPVGFHKPFWRNTNKKDVAAKMQNDALLVVSASTEEVQSQLPKLYEMKVVAGGVSKTPLEFTKKMILDYEKLPQADSHFKEVKYDATKKTLYLHLEALGYHARMHLRMKEVAIPNGYQIQWECVRGSFQGMKGLFELLELERQKTEISMTAEYRASKLPLPQVLMGAGLEAVGKLTAYKLRDFVQEKYKE